MSAFLESVAAGLEDFIAARYEDIAKAESQLEVLRHGPGPDQLDLLLDEPALRRCRRREVGAVAL